MAEAFVIVLAWLNPATADPIRRCLCGPFKYKKENCTDNPYIKGYKIKGTNNEDLAYKSKNKGF